MEQENKTKTNKPNTLKDLKAELKSKLNHRGVQKKEIEVLIDHCLEQPTIYKWLIESLINTSAPFNQKMAWMISHLASKDPHVISKHSEIILNRLEKLQPDGVIRDLLRAYVHIPIKLVDHGQLIDICFRLVGEGKSDLAVKYNASRVIFKLLKIYPDLKPEMRDLLEIQSKIDYSGFGMHAARFLKNEF